MAVINFPDSPSDGDTQDVGGITYTYSSSKGYWTAAASGGGGGGGASVTTDDAAPSNPSDGDLWWDSDGGKMYVYYDDGTSSQWVSVSVPGATGSTGPAGADGADGADGSAQSYTNFAAFPSTGNTLGDLAVAQDTKALYMWDGTEWDRVSLGNDESPVITTEPPTTFKLNSDGTTSTIAMVAQDPEGFDVTYGIAYKTTNNARPSQLSSDTTIDQANGVFTFTPSSNTSNAGSFRARLSASDGARITTRLVDISLGFIPQESALIGHYDFGDTNSYSGTGTTLTDLSSAGNDLTLTVGNGSMGTDVYNFATNSSMNMGVLAAQKTLMFIWNPPDPYPNHILISNNGTYPYTAIFSTGSGDFYYPSGGWGTWSGETVEYLINGGNPGNNRNASYNRLTLGSFNSCILSGIQMTSGTMYYNTYPSWTAAHGLRAILAWNTVLTATEKEQAHNYYATKVGSSNMAAWTP